jgi:hypothetical protein
MFRTHLTRSRAPLWRTTNQEGSYWWFKTPLDLAAAKLLRKANSGEILLFRERANSVAPLRSNSRLKVRCGRSYHRPQHMSIIKIICCYWVRGKSSARLRGTALCELRRTTGIHPARKAKGKSPTMKLAALLPFYLSSTSAARDHRRDRRDRDRHRRSLHDRRHRRRQTVQYVAWLRSRSNYDRRDPCH